MAKQTGPVLVEGTFSGVCFYVADGIGLARVSHPLSRKRVKTAPEFAGLRRYADWLKIASPLASVAYKAVPEKLRERRKYQSLTGKAIEWLKTGKTVPEITLLLQQAVHEMLPVAPAGVRKASVQRKPLTQLSHSRKRRLLSVVNKLPAAINILVSPQLAGRRYIRNARIFRRYNMPIPCGSVLPAHLRE